MRLKYLATAAMFAIAVALSGPANAELSQAAKATSVLDERGKPVGPSAYETAADAIRAGDMAAYLLAIAADTDNEETTATLRGLLLAIDAIAADDLDGAREIVKSVQGDGEPSQFDAYVSAWIYAFEDNADKAIREHRAAASGLPGLTSDLSLAALLESLGQDEGALAVYTSLTPGEIDAPENEFDIQGLYFADIQTVISRRALLLRRLGRIDEAIVVYQRLAEAEPEQAVSYAAAIQSLKDGRGLDDETLTPRTALARTLTDISLALSRSRMFERAQSGLPVNTFDVTKSSLDQAALLLVPEDEDVRQLVIGGLHRNAFYEGAAHVALSAPELKPDLGMSAALALMLQQEPEQAKKALGRALELEIDEDDEFGIKLRAAALYSLLGAEDTALGLAEDTLSAADNPSRMARASAAKADILQHYARYEEALVFASEARRLDDTHDRRMYLTTILGELDRDDDALKILRQGHLERPNDPYMLNTLGYFLISHTDRYEEGFRLLARASKLAPRNAYIRDSFGWARYKLGHIESAGRIIESSRELLAPERHWEIEDHLGDIYWHEGHKDKAREAWEDALEMYPPVKVRESIEGKLKDGITEPAPEKRPLPSLSLDGDGRLTERDI
jgi:tetratricopeptide (TPR) repeat protein